MNLARLNRWKTASAEIQSTDTGIFSQLRAFPLQSVAAAAVELCRCAPVKSGRILIIMIVKFWPQTPSSRWSKDSFVRNVRSLDGVELSSVCDLHLCDGRNFFLNIFLAIKRSIWTPWQICLLLRILIQEYNYFDFL